MFRIAVSCCGLTNAEGSASVNDILEEFAQRPWHTALECSWSSGVLTLKASNDFDSDGQALLDEFGDAIHACTRYSAPIRLQVVSVVAHG
jgi:hypothetical protein